MNQQEQQEYHRNHCIGNEDAEENNNNNNSSNIKKSSSIGSENRAAYYPFVPRRCSRDSVVRPCRKRRKRPRLGLLQQQNQRKHQQQQQQQLFLLLALAVHLFLFLPSVCSAFGSLSSCLSLSCTRSSYSSSMSFRGSTKSAAAMPSLAKRTATTTTRKGTAAGGINSFFHLAAAASTGGGGSGSGSGGLDGNSGRVRISWEAATGSSAKNTPPTPNSTITSAAATTTSSTALMMSSASSSSSSSSSSSKNINKEEKRKKNQNPTQKKNDDDNDDKEQRSRLWMSWMKGGTPRGTNKMSWREPAELGGLPREDRYSSRDWFHNMRNVVNSAILKDIRSPVIAATSWATFLTFLHQDLLRKGGTTLASRMYLPAAPHSLMMSALGLLLVFRTNTAYQRFAEGRKIWEDIVNSCRDLSRMLLLYDRQIGKRKRRRIQRLLATFPYLLRHRIRPNLVMRRVADDETYLGRDPKHTLLLYQDSGSGLKDTDPEAAAAAEAEEMLGRSRRKPRPLFWVDKRTLPWRLFPSEQDDDSLELCVRAQNRPLWVCDRMAAEIKEIPDQQESVELGGRLLFSSRERLAMMGHVDKLSKSIGGSERIHQTVVPLNYARHTLRALTVWLFTLPLALVKEFGFATGPVLFIVAWLLFGVYEIGYSIEDPFQGTLRLSILCDTIRRDVLSDETTRSTAFVLPERNPKHKKQLQSRASETTSKGNQMKNGIQETSVINGAEQKKRKTATSTVGTTAFVQGEDEDDDYYHLSTPTAKPRE